MLASSGQAFLFQLVVRKACEHSSQVFKIGILNLTSCKNSNLIMVLEKAPYEPTLKANMMFIRGYLLSLALACPIHFPATSSYSSC